MLRVTISCVFTESLPPLSHLTTEYSNLLGTNTHTPPIASHRTLYLRPHAKLQSPSVDTHLGEATIRSYATAEFRSPHAHFPMPVLVLALQAMQYACTPSSTSSRPLSVGRRKSGAYRSAFLVRVFFFPLSTPNCLLVPRRNPLNTCLLQSKLRLFVSCRRLPNNKEWAETPQAP
jgi:hypothetical protein